MSTAENLKVSGFSESQAKAITETVREAQQQNLDVLITKGDSENGVENLEVCLSGFLLIRSRTSFAGMTFLRNYSHYIVIPSAVKHRPGIQGCFYKVGLQTAFDPEFG